VPANGEELKQAMGEWLGQLAPWDVFATWTFSRSVTVDGAMFWARRHLRRLEEMAAQRVYSFVGVERGETGGLLHLHALVGNVGHLRAFCGLRLASGEWRHDCCMTHSWPVGYARVFPYNPKLGAKFYVSKYVAKRLAEWELIGFPATPQSSLALSSQAVASNEPSHATL
jgi:hypothetical protein